jgi:hypothetical protein
MGWNSYDCYSYAVTEQEVLDNAEFMAKHLKKFGWEYVVVDYVWSAPKGDPGFAPEQDATFHPRLNMDGNGRLLPDESRFPSAKNGAGFKALGEKLHKMGLKFGIHLMRGIPRQAAAQNCPVEGSTFHAADAADLAGVQCKWLNHMWALNMKNGAGQAYLDSIFRLYASWDVDFVKVDDLSDPYSASEVEGYHLAIQRCGRPMVLSLSPGPSHLDNAEHLKANANMWRLLWDLWDEWKPLNEAFDESVEWNAFRGNGHWPDLDMLPLGQLRIFGPWMGPPDTPSRFTPDEARTLMTLWMITKSPLIYGGDLPRSTPETIALLTNAEGLIPYRDASYMPKPVASGPHPIWMSESPNSKERYVAAFNRDSAAATVSVNVGGAKKTYDLWARKNVPVSGGVIEVEIPSHGCAYFKLD